MRHSQIVRINIQNYQNVIIYSFMYVSSRISQTTGCFVSKQITPILNTVWISYVYGGDIIEWAIFDDGILTNWTQLVNNFPVKSLYLDKHRQQK